MQDVFPDIQVRQQRLLTLDPNLNTIICPPTVIPTASAEHDAAVRLKNRDAPARALRAADGVFRARCGWVAQRLRDAY